VFQRSGLSHPWRILAASRVLSTRSWFQV